MSLRAVGTLPEIYFLLVFFFGRLLRFVPAKSSSCFLLIDLAILFDAPLSDDLLFSPRFAASAAPAAICCFFDFAGILIVRSYA
jgi:hypothetical protein